MKRSDTCSRFLEITYESCSYQLNEPKAAGGHVPVISLIFARVIYDAFNANSMVTVMLCCWPYNNCTFVSATVSHNYSDNGTIKVNMYILYINTPGGGCTSGHNTNYQQRQINGFDVVPAASNVNCSALVASDLSSGQALHDIYENRCSEISFCSTVSTQVVGLCREKKSYHLTSTVFWP